MRRSPLGAGAKSLERGSTFKPRPIDYANAQATRKGKPRKPRVPGGASKAAWGATARSRACAVCGQRATQGHHIITQQELRHACGGELARFRWDQRNLLALCNGCHAGHHARSRPIPLSVLRAFAPDVFAFAVEIDRTWWVERTYP